jgi:hypothetical protein
MLWVPQGAAHKQTIKIAHGQIFHLEVRFNVVGCVGYSMERFHLEIELVDGRVAQMDLDDLQLDEDKQDLHISRCSCTHSHFLEQMSAKLLFDGK